MSTAFTCKLLTAVALIASLIQTAECFAAATADGSLDPVTGYNLPPKAILDVMRAPLPPVPLVNPTRDRILLTTTQLYPSIARVATPFLKLAGVRVETINHSRHDTEGGYGVVLCIESMNLVQVADKSQTSIKLPGNMCAKQPIWNADGTQFAFENTTHDAVELWIGDGRTGKVRKVENVRVNQMLDEELHWMPDQKTLLVKLVPEHLGHHRLLQLRRVGPSIQDANGEKGESSTYENRDTLRNTHDEDLFDYYVSTQIALVDTQTTKVTLIGKPDRIDTIESAPDGHHILVTTIHKPYSYVNTSDHFPHEVDVWDISQHDAPLAHHIASIPLADRVPIAGVPLGPRDFAWRATAPATLVWSEALDGGNWKTTVPARDKVMMQKAPFTGDPIELTRTEQRFEGFAWGTDPATALLIEDDENRHWMKTSLMDVDHPNVPQRVIWDMSSDEKYANPGQPVLQRLANGEVVMRQDGDVIYTSGIGSSTDGDRPFLDRFNLKTLKSERLFRSSKDAYERFLGFTGPTEKEFLTWHQTPTDPPNAFVRTLGGANDAAPGEAAFQSSSAQITRVTDPTPQIRGITKRLVKYKRADGLDLSFTMYTPPGYKEGTRVPTILYAYPLDYAQATTAAQTTGSQQTFTFLYEYRLLLLAGYAIMDRASFPVVGDPKKAYDDYENQLIEDAKAAVDEGVRMGVVDPDRVGVTATATGH